MKDRIGHLNHKYTNLIKVEVRLDIIMIREDFKTGLGQITCIEEGQDTGNIIEAGQDIILIIEIVMGITQEEIKGMVGFITIMVQEEVIEVKITIGIVVGHMRDRPEIEEIADVQAVVDQDLVQGQLQIEIGLDALSLGNTITSQGNVQLGKQVGKQNKYNKCSIWTKIRRYYRLH